MKEKIKKIALVGCGRISKSHIKSIIKNSERCELCAICDNNSYKLNNALKLISDEFELFKSNAKLPELFSSFDELLSLHTKKKLIIDLIVIATPSGYHASQTIKAAKLGINVCTEKPMALNIRDAEEMIEICNLNNVNLFVVKQNRLNPTLQDLRQKINNNRFGDIALITVNVFWQRPQEYYDQDDWRGTKNYDGGALMNQAIHYVDLIEWLGGPLSYINAFTATRKRQIETEDTAVLNMKWENGTLGTMSITMLTYPKNIEGSITIIGDRGSAKVGGVALNKYEFFHFKDDINQEEIIKNNYEAANVYGDGHIKYYKNMLDVLEGKDKPICSGLDGLSSIKIICSAYESNRHKKNIKIKN